MEAGTKVGTVNGGVSRGFWIVKIFAFSAVEFHGRCAGYVMLTHWEERLMVAEDAWAFAEVVLLIFFQLSISVSNPSKIVEMRLQYHFCQTSSSDNVSCVDKTVQMSCRLFYLRPHFIIAIDVEYVGNEIKRMIVVLDFLIEACEVESIGEIVFVNLTKVFVAFRRNELR